MSSIVIEQLAARVGKADLLRLLDEVGGLAGTRVGAIRLSAGTATVEVPDGWEQRVAKALDGALLHGRKIRARAGGSPSAGAAGTPDDHFARSLRLLELERVAEAERAAARARKLTAAEAERLGETLLDMTIVDEEAGLGGRYLLTLLKRRRTPLPWTRLGVGSPVVLSPEAQPPKGQRQMVRGVVAYKRSEALLVAVAALPEEMEDVERWRVDLSSDEISSQRQRSALERAAAARGDRLAQLRDTLLGLRAAEFDASDDEPGEPLDEGLNAQQRAAVNWALAARDVALLHGPPGTGKTTTVVELIRRAVARGDRVLACGPSNMAVDNILERLIDRGVRVVRLGHPARVMADLRGHTLDLLVERHEDVRVARKLVKDALALFRRAARHTRAKPEPGARREMRAEAKSLLADARRFEAQAVEHILDMADVVCATTTGLDDGLLGARQFDLVVIDEACQSAEPGCWIPLARGNRAVLAGDHRQLPPTVLSAAAERQGFAVSLFERLAEFDSPRLLRRLEVQYRMHERIMDFSSQEFYDAALVADDAVRAHLLAELDGVTPCPLTQLPVEFIDTAGAGWDEALEPDGESRLNHGEARLIVAKVAALTAAGVSAEQMGVITPYAAQARLLREMLPNPELEIDTVDGFQGREKEAILISLVRSNTQGEIGFLADLRRMNVALTRARRKLIVVGDSATLAAEPFYARWIEYCESIGAYHTVWEEDGAV